MNAPRSPLQEFADDLYKRKEEATQELARANKALWEARVIAECAKSSHSEVTATISTLQAMFGNNNTNQPEGVQNVDSD